MLTWAIVTNTLLMSLYSANNMPYSALGGVMSADQSERNKLNAYRLQRRYLRNGLCRRSPSCCVTSSPVTHGRDDQ